MVSWFETTKWTDLLCGKKIKFAKLHQIAILVSLTQKTPIGL
jgi:hypothetical protein